MVKTIIKYVPLSLCLFYLVSCKHHQTHTKFSDSDSTTADNKSHSIHKQYSVKLGVSESDIIDVSIKRR